jgi:hypothetical protein
MGSIPRSTPVDAENPWRNRGKGCGELSGFSAAEGIFFHRIFEAIVQALT